jgi:hypothetical protein
MTLRMEMDPLGKDGSIDFRLAFTYVRADQIRVGDVIARARKFPKTINRENDHGPSNIFSQIQQWLQFCVVDQIELQDAELVWDIEVEETHCFFAGGVLVHNSNYGQARSALYHESILPLCDFMFQSFNSTWLRRFGDDLLLDYDSDQIFAIQEDLKMAYERLSQATFLTINEKRIAVGYPGVDGGDVILVPLTSVPLEAVSDTATLAAHWGYIQKVLQGAGIQSLSE